MTFESAQVLWNNIEKNTSSYTPSELQIIKEDFESIEFSKRNEMFSSIGLVCVLLAGVCTKYSNVLPHLQSIIYVSIVMTIIGLGIAFAISYTMRIHQQNIASSIAYKLARSITEKRKEIHQKSMIIQRKIDVWSQYLLEQDIPKTKITAFQQHLSQNLKTEFIVDPHTVLSNDCVFLRIAAKHAQIPINVFTQKTIEIPVRKELLYAV